MKNTIKELAAKYDVATILKRLEEAENVKTVKIGFIGEFSSGKTSLINSVLGTKLPVDINPCTKAITVIEPTEGIEKGSYRYFIEEGEERRFIEFDEFGSIADGGGAKVCGIQIQPCRALPQGCLFIDTPGIQSIDGNEAALTYSYLSLLDAAVFCIDVTSGTINSQAVDFLKNNVPINISKNRLVFALTFSDERTESQKENIKKQIIKILDSLGFIIRPESKIIMTSCKEDNSEKLYNFLKNTVLGNMPAIYEDRKKSNYKEIGEDLLSFLREKEKAFQYSSTEIDEKIEELEEEKRKLSDDKSELSSKLEDFRRKIETKISNHIRSRIIDFENSKDDVEVALKCDTMFNELGSILSRDINTFLKEDFDFSEREYIFSEASVNLKARLNEIINYRNLGVMAGTAIATAAIGGLSGALGNSVEAAGGATATSIAKNAGEAGTKEIAKKAGGTVATTMAGTADGFIKKGLMLAGNIMRDINPLEHVGDFFSKSYKSNAVSEIASMAPQIAINIIDIIKPTFDEKYFQPLSDNLNECANCLKMAKKQKDKESIDFSKNKQILHNDIEHLSKIIG